MINVFAKVCSSKALQINIAKLLNQVVPRERPSPWALDSVHTNDFRTFFSSVVTKVDNLCCIVSKRYIPLVVYQLVYSKLLHTGSSALLASTKGTLEPQKPPPKASKAALRGFRFPGFYYSASTVVEELKRRRRTTLFP